MGSLWVLSFVKLWVGHPWAQLWVLARGPFLREVGPDCIWLAQAPRYLDPQNLNLCFVPDIMLAILPIFIITFAFSFKCSLPSMRQCTILVSLKNEYSQRNVTTF